MVAPGPKRHRTGQGGCDSFTKADKAKTRFHITASGRRTADDVGSLKPRISREVGGLGPGYTVVSALDRISPSDSPHRTSAAISARGLRTDFSRRTCPNRDEPRNFSMRAAAPPYGEMYGLST